MKTLLVMATRRLKWTEMKRQEKKKRKKERGEKMQMWKWQWKNRPLVKWGDGGQD